MLLAILMLLASGGEEGVSVTLRDVVPVITAIGGLVTGVLAVRRGEREDRVQREQTEITSLIQGYTNQIAAYSSIVQALQEEVARLRKQFDIDHKAWDKERSESYNERESLRQQTREMLAEIEDLKKSQRIGQS